MNRSKNISTGVSFGVIIGLVYCILLFFRWQSAANFIRFALLTFVNYIIILGILFYEAFYRRKQEEGGYVTMKELLQTLLISVLIFEFFYSLYNYIHLTYIDPGVIDRMKLSMEEMLDKAGDRVTSEQRQESLNRLDKLKEATNLGKIITSYFTGVAISGIFALIISAIVKKKKPVFQELS